MIGGAALDGDGDDLAGQLVGVFLQLRLDLTDLDGGVVTAFVFKVLQELRLGVLLRQTGDLFQNLQLTLLDEVDLILRGGNGGLTLAQIVLLALEGVELLVQRLFLLLQAALLLLQVGPALFDFLFVFCAGFMDLFLGFDEHLALLVLAALDGFVDDACCFRFRAADLTLGNFLAVDKADQEENDCYC